MLHCHHWNKSCIKMVSKESHFIISLSVREGHKTVFADHNFDERRELKWNQIKVLLLTSLMPYH